MKMKKYKKNIIYLLPTTYLMNNYNYQDEI